nr:putative ribonuclease H-like domain-containing protein [Tanacetum cinerariifolium]
MIFNALQDPSWVEAMHEELFQFKIQNVWSLVECLKRVRPIGTKWVLKNKKDERGIVIRNKAMLVAQRHTQEEGIDYDEVFAPVARIEAIRLFLAYASFMGFTVYQMDVKSAFLYGTIVEEVYVMQPPRFQDLEFPARVYKVEKAMYGLHQAPRAWYGTLSKHLLINGFQRGTIDQTLFIIRQRGDFILLQVYVDDIIFGSSNRKLSREFEALMHEKFQMSAMGELNFFLRLQVLHKEDGIFLSQDKYVGDILKKFRYSDVRSANTPMDKKNPWGKDGTGKIHQVTPKECHLHVVKRIFRYLKGHPKLGLWYPKESPFDFVAYLDSDYGGATQDHKSTTRGCQFLGRRLISWQCKKQTIVATSTTEAEYVTAASDCGQVPWIQNQLLDYGTETTDEGTKILANVDGKLKTISESSIRRNLKLNDDAGIRSLPDAKLFENLTLMGYNISPNQKFTFQKGQFSHQWKYLIHTIMQCLSLKSNGFNEFSSNISTALVCLATNRVYNFSKMIFDVKMEILLEPTSNKLLVDLILRFLKDEKWYAKFSKYEFWFREVQFLAYMVHTKGNHVDPAKIKAIKKWEKIMVEFVTKLPRTSRGHDTFWETRQIEPSVHYNFQEELQIINKLQFIDEPLKIMDPEVKKLKHSRISIIKVQWNSPSGPEFTWEHKDKIKPLEMEALVDAMEVYGG